MSSLCCLLECKPIKITVAFSLLEILFEVNMTTATSQNYICKLLGLGFRVLVMFQLIAASVSLMIEIEMWLRIDCG